MPGVFLMKPLLVRARLFVIVSALFAVPFAGSAADQPVITSIWPDTTNIVINVNIPAGITRVVLESRTRLDAGTWVPVASRQVDGNGGSLELKVPKTSRLEVLRVRADLSQPLPAALYTGTNMVFAGPSNSYPSAPPYSPNDIQGEPSGRSPDRQVTESDIWKLDGDYLFFFNQYRGLQIIDISRPDLAHVTGTVELPAAGEQMYLLDESHVVLLVQPTCGNDQNSGVLVVGVTNGSPTVIKNLPVPGWIQESRMVGTALYVASQTYRPVAGSQDTAWEWGTAVSSFDLAQPDAPRAVDSLFYGGYGNVIAATDTFLFVVTSDPTNWWQSTVQILDITSPEGQMAEYEKVHTSGRIIDKFKMNYSDGVFTAISEDWRNAVVTSLETFSLPDPRSAQPGGVTKLGSLELAKGERLFATRFDGSLVYIVTFLRIDPLWIVDLSTPATPKIAGEVQVPGWSTYIYPMASKLVTVGVESNHVAVSLFDVANPAKASLLSRVLLGDSYSWSEANYDEKAFSVMEDIGLILVPYSGDTTNGWASQVQLVDLGTTNLVARGVINHPLTPRRATYTHNRVLSLSGWELLSVDATDRDKPAVKGELQLAWPVDRVLKSGDYLLEIAGGGGWTPGEHAAIRVALASVPNDIISTVQLDEGSVSGAELQDGLLYLVQERFQTIYYRSDGEVDTNAPNFTLTVLDARNLPVLTIMGSTTGRFENLGWGAGNWSALWPKTNILVWSGGAPQYWPWGPYLDVAMRPGLANGLFFWPGYGTGDGKLITFDVSAPQLPAFRSLVDFTTNSWWDFSSSFLSGSLIYLSHQSSEQVNPDDQKSEWVQRSYLDVVDYTDPSTPTMRKPVNIPGKLQGISHEGEILYTVGAHWVTNSTDWKDWLDISAYDGVAAHLVSSLALPELWPHPVFITGTDVYVGRPGYTTSTNETLPSFIDILTLDSEGKIAKLGNVQLAQPASEMVLKQGLLAVQENYSTVQLFDATEHGKLIPLSTQNPSSCMWVDLAKSDGSLSEGLWVPFGVYGVVYLPVHSSSE
jgi:hypothetical protein